MTIFFILFCSLLICFNLGVIQFVELVSMDYCDEDGWKKIADKEDEEDKENDDENNDGDIDNDLLTLYQVHLSPVSSQQAEELSEKMFSAPTMCSTRFFLILFHFLC